MPEQHDFESRLVRSLETYTTVVDTEFDEMAIARRALNQRRAWRNLMPSRAQIRLVQIAFALLLLGLALAAAALVASQPPDPGELVRRSQAVHADPPPFTMVITAFDPPNDRTSVACSDSRSDEPIRYLYFYDGEDGFRFECLANGNARGADFQVRRGDLSGSFLGGEWHEPAPGDVLQPPGTVRYLNWGGTREVDPARGQPLQTGGSRACPEWSLTGREVVADRPAWHVACGEEHYWIDTGSHLLVRLTIGDLLISEATALEVGPPPDHVFVVAPPERSRRYLVVGQTVTEWELPRYDTSTGASAVVSSTSLAGRRAMVLFHNAQHCREQPCFGIRDFTAVAERYADRIGGVIIVQGEYPDAVVQQAAQAGIPMVSDDGTVAPVWLADPGTIVLIDDHGRVDTLLSPSGDTSGEYLAESIEAFAGREAAATAGPSDSDGTPVP